MRRRRYPMQPIEQVDHQGCCYVVCELSPRQLESRGKGLRESRCPLDGVHDCQRDENQDQDVMCYPEEVCVVEDLAQLGVFEPDGLAGPAHGEREGEESDREQEPARSAAAERQ